MAVQLPMIHFKPAENYVPSSQDYSCPLYKTSARAGVSGGREGDMHAVITVHQAHAEYAI